MRFLKIAAMAFAIGGSLASAGAPASAAPLGAGALPLAQEAQSPLVEKAQWGHRRHYRPHRAYGHYRPYRTYGHYRPYRAYGHYRPYRRPIYGAYRPYPVYGFAAPRRCWVQLTAWGPQKVCRRW